MAPSASSMTGPLSSSGCTPFLSTAGEGWRGRCSGFSRSGPVHWERPGPSWRRSWIPRPLWRRTGRPGMCEIPKFGPYVESEISFCMGKILGDPSRRR